MELNGKECYTLQEDFLLECVLFSVIIIVCCCASKNPYANTNILGNV